MLSSNNILHPASGQPIAVPGQDIVLGLYYLTKPRPARKGEGMHFFDSAEAVRAYENGVVDLNAIVYLKLKAGKKIYMGALEKDAVCLREAADDNGNIEQAVKAGEKIKFLTLKEDNVIKTTVGRIIFKVTPSTISTTWATVVPVPWANFLLTRFPWVSPVCLASSART